VLAGRRLLVVIISCSTSACTGHNERLLNKDQQNETKRSLTRRSPAYVVMLVSPAACEEAQRIAGAAATNAAMVAATML